MPTKIPMGGCAMRRSRAANAVLALVGLTALALLSRGIFRGGHENAREETPVTAAPNAVAPVPKEVASEEINAALGSWIVTGRVVRLRLTTEREWAEGKGPYEPVPCAGEKLRLKAVAEAEASFAPLEAVTGGDGRFEIKGAPGGIELDVAACTAGIVLDAESFELVAAATAEPHDLGDIVKETAAALRVRLLDENDEPIESGTVVVEALPAAHHVGGGEYVEEGLWPHACHVYAWAPGYGCSFTATFVPRDGVLDIHLREAYPVRGRVITPPEAPIPGAEVGVRTRSTGELPVSARTDAEGRFLLELEPGHVLCGECWVVLTAKAEGYTTRDVSFNEDFDEVEIVLLPEAVVAGKVVADDTGLPVAGVALDIDAEDSETYADVAQAYMFMDATTDAEGRFSFSSLYPGAYSFRIGDGEKYTFVDPKPIVLAEGQHLQGVELRVQPVPPSDGGEMETAEALNNPAVWGFVRDGAGKPIAGARVELDGSREATDLNGVFMLGCGLPEQQDTVYVWRDGHAEAEEAVQRGRTALPLRIRLQRSGSIAGRVLDGDGSVCEGAVVGASTLRGSLHSFYACDSTSGEGEYCIEGLQPGDYCIDVQVEGRASPPAVGVKVEPDGRVSGIDFVLPEGTTVEGTVVDDTGTPLADVKVDVDVSVPDSDGKQSGSAWTNREGCFSIRGLSEGSASVYAEKRGFARSWHEIEVPGPAVELRLDRMATVFGKVRSPGEALLGFGNIEAHALDAQDRGKNADIGAGGEFRFLIEPGSYVLRFSAHGYAKTVLDATFAPGDTRRLDVSLARGATLAATIVRADTGVLEKSLYVDVEVDVEGPFASMGDDGRVEIDDVPEGDRAFTAVCDGYALAVDRLHVRREGMNELTLVLQTGRGINGKVEGFGHRLPGLRVEAFTAAGVRAGAATTSAAGYFELRDLAPGQYQLSIKGTGRIGETIEHTVRAVVAERGFTYVSVDIHADGNGEE